MHPATLILVWGLLVTALQLLSGPRLLVLASFMLLAPLALSGRKFLLLLRRTRWVMFSLLLIYAYVTPGHAIVESLGAYSPTREGLADGTLQLLRLLAALGGLALLLDRLHRPQLVAGLYVLLAPLSLFRLSRERVAVRLALTLHYAEVAMLRGAQDWRTHLQQLFAPVPENFHHIELSLPRFAWRDVLAVLAVLAGSGWLLR
jgi:energy-coupling factor transport system permease protein